jgi:hypothetical protein
VSPTAYSNSLRPRGHSVSQPLDHASDSSAHTELIECRLFTQTNARTTVPTHRSTLLYTLNFRCSHNQALKHSRAHAHMLSMGCAMLTCVLCSQSSALARSRTHALDGLCYADMCLVLTITLDTTALLAGTSRGLNTLRHSRLRHSVLMAQTDIARAISSTCSGTLCPLTRSRPTHRCLQQHQARHSARPSRCSQRGSSSRITAGMRMDSRRRTCRTARIQ